MRNNEVFRDSIYSELEEGLSYSGGEIEIDDPQSILVHDRNFCPVITELVNNCLNKGATRVTVKVDWGRIIVEDDIVHTPEELERILANITNEKPKTTKEPDPEVSYPLGGVGIISSRRILASYEGSLSYEVTEDGRIKAIVSWSIASE